MENEILDYEEKEDEKIQYNYRRFYILIESLLFFPFFFLSINSIVIFSNRSLERSLLNILGLLIILLYITSPLVRLKRKETTPKLALLYYLQNGLFILYIIALGEMKLDEHSLLGKILGLSALLLFNIIPHLEIKKYATPLIIHVLVFFICFSVSLSIFDVVRYVSSSVIIPNPATNINLVGGLMSFVLFCTTLFLMIRNWNRYSYLAYLFPRLLFAIFLISFQVFKF